MEIKVYNVKFKIGDKLYFTVGSPKYQVVYKAELSKIVFSNNNDQEMYEFIKAKLLHKNEALLIVDQKQYEKKTKEGKDIDYGFFYGYNVDTERPNGNIRIFTTKDRCIKYLRKELNK